MIGAVHPPKNRMDDDMRAYSDKHFLGLYKELQSEPTVFPVGLDTLAYSASHSHNRKNGLHSNASDHGGAQ